MTPFIIFIFPFFIKIVKSTSYEGKIYGPDPEEAPPTEYSQDVTFIKCIFYDIVVQNSGGCINWTPGASTDILTIQSTIFSNCVGKSAGAINKLNGKTVISSTCAYNCSVQDPESKGFFAYIETDQDIQITDSVATQIVSIVPDSQAILYMIVKENTISGLNITNVNLPFIGILLNYGNAISPQLIQYSSFDNCTSGDCGITLTYYGGTITSTIFVNNKMPTDVDSGIIFLIFLYEGLTLSQCYINGNTGKYTIYGNTADVSHTHLIQGCNYDSLSYPDYLPFENKDPNENLVLKFTMTLSCKQYAPQEEGSYKTHCIKPPKLSSYLKLNTIVVQGYLAL